MPRESKKNKIARTASIIAELQKLYPAVECSLNYSNPLELLIATILSAQCTDARVNIVTESLFAKYKTAADFADAKLSELEQDVRSTGFYRNKAKNIKAACVLLVDKFNSKVPQTMEELLELPGVARKTANVVLGNAFGINAGVVVDTHVKRLSGRMKLTANANPDKIERDLMPLVPQKLWAEFSHLLVFHGREFCTARKPKCGLCPLAEKKLCPSAGKV